MIAHETPGMAEDECKLSIRINTTIRQDVKAVASLTGTNMEEWVKSVIESELKRLQPQLQAIRKITAARP